MKQFDEHPLRAALARHAAVKRHHPGDVQLHAELKRDVRAESLILKVRAVVAQQPPLTEEQCERITDLLAGA